MLSQHGIQHLAARLCTSTCLRSLRLDFCVGTAFSHSLAAGLGRCTGLTSLSLNHVFLDRLWALEYAPRLPLARGLTTLLLAGNRLDSDAACSLADALWRCAALAELRLAHNQIRARGAAVLIAASATCTTLAVLDLSSNEVGLGSDGQFFSNASDATPKQQQQRAETIGHLAQAVAGATALTRLDLASNCLFDFEQCCIQTRWGLARPGLALARA